MSGKSRIVWTLKELTDVIRQRQLNKFDVNIGVSGKRGDGKSTVLFKVFNSFKKTGFRQKKHQVYNREDVVKLLQNQQFGFCWDDEAINSGYKREFQQRGQIDLIKIITNYRDNFNVYASALPFFYSLDKALRELIFIHIHIVERGFAVVLMPLESQIHAQDPWNTKLNIKIEEKENKRLEKDPTTKFRYHKLTTFAGYLYFTDMTKNQRIKYNQIKKSKRAKVYEGGEGQRQLTFAERTYELLMDGKLTKDGLVQMCLYEKIKYSTTVSELNRMLINDRVGKTMTKLFGDNEIRGINSISTEEIKNLVPSL